MSAISVRRSAISDQHTMLDMPLQKEAREAWFKWSDGLALFGAIIVVILVKSGALGAIPF